MKKIELLICAGMATLILSCGPGKQQGYKNDDSDVLDTFKYQTEQFADIKVLRYKIPQFESLKPTQKELIYYLYQAALAGRDILWDQNYKYNLMIRRTLEAVVNTYKGNKNCENYKNFMIYTKKVWVSNGIHHHYSMDKMMPEFPQEYFAELVKNTDKKELPLENGQTVDGLIEFLTPILFDPDVDNKRVNLDAEQDMIKGSANNFYEGVTQKEAEAFYSKIVKKNDPKPVSYGLNSKLVKENGKIVEKTWKVGGLYTQAIEKIVFWLEKAIGVSESAPQKAALEKLVEFYRTGDLKVFDEYCILWTKDTESMVDVVNGFIEVYGDPLGKKGSFESMVSFRDVETTKRVQAICSNAQWFENNSPIDDQYKRKQVKGVTAKAINVVVESGDCSPSTPIGVNLPNADWIRSEYGSKSVSMANIMYSYDEVTKSNGALEEFAYSKQEVAIAKKYSTIADNITTDMHEVIGHGSGQIKDGVGDPSETLKSYASTLEEARADLVALYYIYDKKLIDIGVMPNLKVGRAEYDKYIRNGLLTQLVRLETGKNLEESHMRNRQLICKWVYEKGEPENVIEKKIKNGKTFFVINDYQKLRKLFGQLLKEIQRIKSEGDYEAGKALVEYYGVKVDPSLHKEVKERWKKLNIAPYAAFINPVLVPIMKDGKIVDVKVEYPKDFTQQMLDYAKNYSFLPTINK